MNTNPDPDDPIMAAAAKFDAARADRLKPTIVEIENYQRKALLGEVLLHHQDKPIGVICGDAGVVWLTREQAVQLHDDLTAILKSE